MQPRHLLLALPLCALLSSTARPASATPPDKETTALPPPARTEAPRPVETRAAEMVESQLVKPLAEKEARRNRFSRAYIPPRARRVRVLDHQRATDGRGAEFVAFAVDERSAVLGPRAADDAGRWRADAIVGCVYPARDEVFIKRGDQFFAAGLLLGRKTPVADSTVCRPALALAPPRS